MPKAVRRTVNPVRSNNKSTSVAALDVNSNFLFCEKKKTKQPTSEKLSEFLLSTKPQLKAAPLHLERFPLKIQSGENRPQLTVKIPKPTVKVISPFSSSSSSSSVFDGSHRSIRDFSKPRNLTESVKVPISASYSSRESSSTKNSEHLEKKNFQKNFHTRQPISKQQLLKAPRFSDKIMSSDKLASSCVAREKLNISYQPNKSSALSLSHETSEDSDTHDKIPSATISENDKVLCADCIPHVASQKLKKQVVLSLNVFPQQQQQNIPQIDLEDIFLLQDLSDSDSTVLPSFYVPPTAPSINKIRPFSIPKSRKLLPFLQHTSLEEWRQYMGALAWLDIFTYTST